MKILNRYILREHIPPFIFAVLIITFLLILDTIPRIVDMVIDKDIAFMVVLELLFLNLAWMIALSVPMAVLVATVNVFGRMTSDAEIIAIKASGINLLKILVPLFISAAILTFGMIQFMDKVLPRLNHKARVLAGDIRMMRPTLTFRPGVFITDINGYIILIEKINHITSEVEGVRINEMKNPQMPKLTVASSGLMHFIDNGQTIKFTLRDGETHMFDTKNPENYRKLDYTEQVIYVGGVGSELKRSKTSYQTDREMNIEEMQAVVQKSRDAIIPLNQLIDKTVENKLSFLFSDTLEYPHDSTITDEKALSFLKDEASNLHQKLRRDAENIISQQKTINKYKIEIYKKYSIPAATFAFILIGAPLAIKTRRGGMGITVTVSIILFTIYWGFLIGGEDLSDRNLISPFWAMWAANFLTSGLGLYLLIKIITEKPLLSFFRK